MVSLRGNGLVTLEELTRLVSPLGVRSANVAKLFTAAQLPRVKGSDGAAPVSCKGE